MSTIVTAQERPTRLRTVEDLPVAVRRSYFSSLIAEVFPLDREMECRPTLIASVTGDAGVSFVCSYLATELAYGGNQVLLADTGTLLRVARLPSLMALELAEPLEPGRLWVLGPKQVPPSLSEAHHSRPSVAGLLAACRQRFTHVILDSPALSVSDDAISLATAVYGTILAVQCDTRRQDVVEACDRISSLGGRILGSIFNGRPSGSMGRGIA